VSLLTEEAQRTTAEIVDGALAVHSPLGPNYTSRKPLSSGCTCPDCFVAVFRCVDMLADKRNHVSWTRDPSQAGVEDKFRHSCSCLDVGRRMFDVPGTEDPV